MNPYLVQAILAALPLLGFTRTAQSGVLWGGTGVLIFMASTYLFFVLRPLLPERFYRISFFLLIILMGASAIQFLKQALGNSAFLLPMSICLLTPPDFFRKRRSQRLLKNKNWIRGFYFWALLAGHGLLSEGLFQGLGIHFAAHPAGSFFLLGLALVLLPEEIKK